ncbi:uncharacterized protein I303_100936 [Kwoniella dejecticola CBS 10117]|uniref:FAD/NAD(P)-binding domain-containing protein n=1 Tax=Kwoniella dejecticola CBS 10117 TaxID=1296121 RepID=A0A1A6AGG6_9TREE|nr:uncharacterized protein I303_00940 [Kwoniella dejecticola CBS 10117]OBR89118.1 hypothetical protein I303_00940 [Kwoniella dejecticola CBS 10117]
MSEYKNIVIVGASAAGQQLANYLSPNLPTSHRIILIDALDYAFWPIASLRAAVVPGWEKKVTVPLTQETVFPADSIHKLVVPNKVVELKENSVVLENPFEGSNEIPFCKCILATGAQQPSPMRPAVGSTRQGWEDSLAKTQGEIKQANKIVVIGGGAVGLEIAGEIRAAYPDKTITVVHSSEHVLHPTPDAPNPNGKAHSYSSPPTLPKLSLTLEKLLKEMKIDLITNDKVVIPANQSTPEEWSGAFGLQDGVKTVKLQSGKTLEADYVFVSIGNKPNVSLVESADKGAVISGLVGVDEYLRVISDTPNSPLSRNYYAIGDCSSTPGWKTYMGADYDAKGCAVNIANEAKGKAPKKYVRPTLAAMMIPLGPEKGAGTLTFPVVGTWQVPGAMVKGAKGSKLFVEDLFYGRFKGAKKVAAGI